MVRHNEKLKAQQNIAEALGELTATPGERDVFDRPTLPFLGTKSIPETFRGLSSLEEIGRIETLARPAFLEQRGDDPTVQQAYRAGKEVTAAGLGAVSELTSRVFPNLRDEQALARTQESRNVIGGIDFTSWESIKVGIKELDAIHNDRSEIVKLLMEFGAPEMVIAAGVTGGIKVTRTGVKALRTGIPAARTFGRDVVENVPASVRRMVDNAVTEEAGGLGIPSLPKRTVQGTFKSTTVPSNAAAKAFGLEPIETLDLSRTEQIKNVVKAAFNQVKDDPVGTAVTRFTKKSQQNLESIATSVAHEKDAILHQAFDIDEAGRVLDANLQNVHPARPNPGRSDLTEGFETFKPHMTPRQVDAIEQIRVIDEPYAAVSDDLGIAKTVVEEGGFYSPRGRVVDGEEFLGNSGIDKPRVFASHGEGIEWAMGRGMSYPSYRVAEAARITDLGKRSINKHAGDFLKSAVDPESGLPVASTARSRMPADIRDAYDKMGGKVRSRRESIKKQEVRLHLLDKEVTRGGKGVASAEERAALIEGRLTEKGPAYVPADFKSVNEDLTNAIAEAQTFAGFVKEDAALLRSGKRTLSKSERQLDNAVDELVETANESARFLQVSPSTGAKLDVAAMTRRVDVLSNKVVRLTDDAVVASEKVDSLLGRAAISKDMSLAAREEIRASRRLQRNMYDQNRSVQSLNRELRALDREERRLRRSLKGSEKRLTTAEVRNAKTREGLLALQEESGELTKSYKAWQRRDPRGQRAIPNLATVSGNSFPDELARAMNLELERGKTPVPFNWVQAESQLYRSVRATGEFSAAGIQLLLGMYNDPAAYGNAIKVMFRGFGTERALGQFLVDRSSIAKQSGRLTSTEWARLGLRFGAGDTEFRLGQGVLRAIEKGPLVERLNRSFGFAGDGMRFAWVDDILKEELKNRSLKQIRDSGDLERMVDFVNNSTGWSRDKFAGSLGDFLLFAPRFFQSRLNTLAKGMGGLRPGSPIDQRLARNSLVKMIGWGTFATVATNEMLGNETDFHPFLDDNFEPSFEPSSRKNPNFMRIRAAGRDWSVFGTWDSILGMLISVASGNPQDALRGLASGPIQLAWDQIAGENFQGEDVPGLDDPVEFAQWFVKSHLPFATEEGVAVVGQITEGVGLNTDRVLPALLSDQAPQVPAEPDTPSADVGGQAVFEPDAEQLIRGTGSLFTGAFGVKGTPITPTEERNAVSEQILEERGLSGKLYEQDPSVVKDIRQDPRYKNANEAVFDSRRGRGSELQAYYDDVAARDEEFNKDINLLSGQFGRSLEGTIGRLKPEDPIFGKQVRERIGDLQREKAQDLSNLREEDKNVEALTFLDELDPPTSQEGKAQQAYIDAIFDDTLEDSVTGFYDFAERDRRIEALEAEWGVSTIATVQSNLRGIEPELIRQLREARETINASGYFDLTNRMIDGLGLRDLYNQYLAEPPSQRRFFLATDRMAPLKKAMDALDSPRGWGPGGKFSLRQAFLLDANPEVDRLLLKWGYRPNPTHPDVQKEVQNKAVGRELQRQGSTP